MSANAAGDDSGNAPIADSHGEPRYAYAPGGDRHAYVTGGSDLGAPDPDGTADIHLASPREPEDP